MTSAGPRFEPMTTGVRLDRALQLYRANFSLTILRYRDHLLYYDLRIRKKGCDLDTLSRAFARDQAHRRAR